MLALTDSDTILSFGQWHEGLKKGIIYISEKKPPFASVWFRTPDNPRPGQNSPGNRGRTTGCFGLLPDRDDVRQCFRDKRLVN